MKKISDIKIGILIGLLAATLVVAYKPLTEYYALAALIDDAGDGDVTLQVTDKLNNYTFDAVNTFSEVAGKVLGGKDRRLSYDDVFGSATYHNLYLLMFQSAFVEPEESALKTIASAYGFTLAEAKAVQQGSLQPILKKFSGGSEKSQQDMYNKATEFAATFNELYDIAALQQELSIGASASEIFSNGEVLDSGFDLVHDLDVIEEVIFGSKTKGTLGGPIDFGGGDDAKELTDKLLASSNPDVKPDVPDIYGELNTNDANTGDNTSTGNADSLPQTFDPKTLVEITSDDICPKPETPLETALNNFQEKNPSNVGTVDAANQDPAVIDAGKEPSIKAADIASRNSDSLVGKLVPEDAGDWSDKPVCNGKFFAVGGGNPEKISADFFICLESITKWAKYETVIPDKPCVKCETDKISAYLNKTLEHSFVPNKVTGNFLEPGKCKSAFMDLLDIKFNLIWAPIPTARKDESMQLKSLRKEWDKFATRSNPLVFQDIPMTYLGDNMNEVALDAANQNVKDGATYTELMDQVSVIKNVFAKQAAEGSQLYGAISEGENFVTYSQDVIKEVDQMTRYFLNFRDIFDNLATNTCPNILKKPKVK